MAEPHDTTNEDPELRQLLDQRRKLNARIRNKKTKAKTEARTQRERRAMLTGLAVMDALDGDATPAEHALIQRWREQWLKRPEERALFGFPPLPPELVLSRISETRQREEERERERESA